MSGRPGRSGGHNRLPVQHHLERGSYRPSLHGPKPSPWPPTTAQPVAQQAQDAPSWQPRAVELSRLGIEGRALVEPLLATYAFSSPEGQVVLEAGHAADRLEELRQAIKTCEPAQRFSIDRAERAWSQHLISLLRELFDR